MCTLIYSEYTINITLFIALSLSTLSSTSNKLIANALHLVQNIIFCCKFYFVISFLSQQHNKFKFSPEFKYKLLVLINNNGILKDFIDLS